jgi:hypothetical protein
MRQTASKNVFRVARSCVLARLRCVVCRFLPAKAAWCSTHDLVRYGMLGDMGRFDDLVHRLECRSQRSNGTAATGAGWKCPQQCVFHVSCALAIIPVPMHSPFLTNALASRVQTKQQVSVLSQPCS